MSAKTAPKTQTAKTAKTPKPAKTPRVSKTKIQSDFPLLRGTPDRFTYALKQHTVEIRSDGWWMCKTHPSILGKPAWFGPFATIEDLCLAIAREYATEIANRHTVLIGSHKLTIDHPLYGLKSTTGLARDEANI